jgi:hypothetical protein
MLMIRIEDHPHLRNLATFRKQLTDRLFRAVIGQVLYEDGFAADWGLLFGLFGEFLAGGLLDFEVAGAQRDSVSGEG